MPYRLARAVEETAPRYYWPCGSADIQGARLRDRQKIRSLANVGAGHTYVVPGLARGACPRAHRFDGANNVYSDTSISFDGITDGFTGVTIACWIRIPALLSASASIFTGRRSSPNSQIAFQLNSDERLVAAVGNASAVVATANDGGQLLANVAYYVAMTYDGATIRRYINGSETGSSAAQTGAVDSFPEAIAARNDNGTFDLELACDLSDLAVWNRGLSAAEIRYLYREGVAAS